MKHRNPLAVFFLSLFTFGIYALVWHVKTKGELNRHGAKIPTSWLLIIPFANLYWIWKYAEGVEQVTGGKISAVMALLLLLLLSIVGIAILQDLYNDLTLVPAGAVPASTPQMVQQPPVVPGAPPEQTVYQVPQSPASPPPPPQTISPTPGEVQPYTATPEQQLPLPQSSQPPQPPSSSPLS
jgi:hypothetical protein